MPIKIDNFSIWNTRAPNPQIKKYRLMTKSELVEMLSDYSDNAEVIFNVDADVDARNKAFTVNHISYLDDDFIPILSSEKPCPKIIIHLKEKKII